MWEKQMKPPPEKIIGFEQYAEGPVIFVVTSHMGRECYSLYYDRLPSWLTNKPSPIVFKKELPQELQHKPPKELFDLYKAGKL
jgi:hypothetical protein